jgi:hypothetical protein
MMKNGTVAAAVPMYIQTKIKNAFDFLAEA